MEQGKGNSDGGNCVLQSWTDTRSQDKAGEHNQQNFLLRGTYDKCFGALVWPHYIQTAGNGLKKTDLGKETVLQICKKI